ncbi:hypothetical protein OHB93_14520 [Microbacterium sp. No. 7]|uniref:hypothetical protein n=1 Tax=Microbacterium sp. No. 7 TaxID=1714373 RepID=UPI0030085E35
MAAAAARHPSLAVVWLDAHGDLHTRPTRRPRSPRRHGPPRRDRAGSLRPDNRLPPPRARFSWVLAPSTTPRRTPWPTRPSRG